MVRKTEPALLDSKWAAFIQTGVSIVAGSRSAENLPSLVRAVGCRVSSDQKKVTVLVYSPAAASLVEHVSASGAIAVVFSQPSTHITLQLKGVDASVEPLKPGDAKLAQRYVRGFVDELAPLGYSEELVSALVWFDASSLAAITFTPSAAFLQTPGPRAGEPLKS